MTSERSWGIVVAAHNSARVIESTIIELDRYFESNSLVGEVVVVENGSMDDTWDVLERIDQQGLHFKLKLARSSQGLGNAIREGLKHIQTENVLITADDLPFGFSDLDYYRENALWTQIAIGSKAHPETYSDRSFVRGVSSFCFRNIRRLLLNVNLGDTQGSILGPTQELRLASYSTCQEGYLQTTELLALVMKSGVQPIEIPVKFRQSMRPSNIRLVSDSIKMVRGLFEIRRRLRSLR